MSCQDDLKISSKRLADVFKTSSRSLDDALKTFLQGLLKTYDQDEYMRLDQDVLKTFSEDEDERRLRDVFKTSLSRRMFAGILL